jgi:hypothetical protein
VSARRAVVLLLWLLWLVPGVAGAQEPSAVELRSRADEALRSNDYPAAIPPLEALVRGFPTSQDEQVFWDLGKICDTYGVDFEKAVTYYRIYLDRFPDGRFATRFRLRLAWLESHRQDWDARKRLTELQAGAAGRTPEENVRAGQALLADDPGTSLAPDVYYWLAVETYKAEQYNAARAYAEDYLATFPANGKDPVERVRAIDLCVKIAIKQRDFAPALARLDELATIAPERVQEFEPLRAQVLFERRAYWVFIASAMYFAIVLIGLVASRPWKRLGAGLRPRRIGMMIAPLLVCTVLPFGILKAIGERVPSTLWVLALSGSLSLILIAAAWPAVDRIGRKAFLALSFLLLAATVYMTFYVTDMAKMFLWPLEEMHRHG